MADTFLLTWNPDRFVPDIGVWDHYIRATARGELPWTQWSTGTRLSGMSRGSRVFLLRQGREPRGVVGSGYVHHDDDIFSDEHFDDATGGRANYIEFVYDHVIDPDNPLPLNLLKTEVAGVNWEPRAGGVCVSPESVPRIEALWQNHVGSPPRTADEIIQLRTRGQGSQQDPVKRKMAEDYAQAWLEEEYRSAGWTVIDVRYKNPFDALASKGGQTRYLEAKGTTSRGDSILLTSGELTHARTHPGQCVLGIVSGIAFKPNGEIDESGTALAIYEPWDPDLGSLCPLQYEWSPG